MVMEFTFGQMDQNMLDSFYIIKSMVKAYMSGMMVENFRVIGIVD